jgi:hypothetical protein
MNETDLQGLQGLNSNNLARILNQFEYKALATRVSSNNMNGDVFLNIQPIMVQFVFSDSTERNQFEAFMNRLKTKKIAPIINTSSPTLDNPFTSNTLLNNSSLHLNDDFNSASKTLTTDQSKIASPNNNKENNQFDPSFSSINSQQIKAPELPYLFQYPSDKLSDESQSKLRDITAPVNSSDVNELIRQAFHKMRSYKL